MLISKGFITIFILILTVHLVLSERGDKGDPGYEGAQGYRGPTGSGGRDGQQGENGEPGDSGISKSDLHKELKRQIEELNLKAKSVNDKCEKNVNCKGKKDKIPEIKINDDFTVEKVTPATK